MILALAGQFMLQVTLAVDAPARMRSHCLPKIFGNLDDSDGFKILLSIELGIVFFRRP